MSPAGVAGVVDVVVTAPGGVVSCRLVRSSPMRLAPEPEAPVVSSVAPVSGPVEGGTAVTVRGPI